MFNLSSDTTMKTLTRLGVAALLTLPLVAAAHQNVYRCPGPDGRMIYTDKACRTGAKLKMSHKGIGSKVTVETTEASAARAKAAPAAPAAPAAASAAASAAAPAASAASAAAPAASAASAAAPAASAAPAAPAAAPAAEAASAAPAPVLTKPTAQGVQL